MDSAPDLDKSLAQAVDAWRRAIGDAAVVTHADLRSEHGQSAIGLDRVPPVVLRPRSEAQVIELVKIANRLTVPIYPVSCGRNWGYGAACTTRPGTVLVDCSAMNDILEFDDELGVVQVGPGVTQAKLSEFLVARGDRWMTPTTGAGPNASILGNALERGYGITPIADHFQALQAIEAVLPSGEVLRSPLAELGAQKVDQLFKWGIGPSMDGLFTQSALGVITSGTIALARRPERVAAFLSKLRDDQLEQAVDAARDLQQQYTGLIGGINLMNRRRVLAMECRPDETDCSPGHAIAQVTVDSLAEQRGISEWSMLGAVYTERPMFRPIKLAIQRRLRQAQMRAAVVDRGRLKTIRRSLSALPSRAARRLNRQAGQLERGLRILEGYPDEIALQLCYWRNQSVEMPGRDLDPVRDRCGLIWYSPLIPMTGPDARRFVQTTERVCLAHEIDPLITLTTVNPRCFDCTVPLLFDVQDEDAVGRAKACYEALFHENAQHGYVPYRMSVSTMGLVMDPGSPFWSTAKAIKDTVDPNAIMSPGRYMPG